METKGAPPLGGGSPNQTNPDYCHRQGDDKGHTHQVTVGKRFAHQLSMSLGDTLISIPARTVAKKDAVCGGFPSGTVAVSVSSLSSLLLFVLVQQTAGSLGAVICRSLGLLLRDGFGWGLLLRLSEATWLWRQRGVKASSPVSVSL